MPRDGFFCPLRSTTVNPAQQHTKDLRVFLFRVAHYPEMFEEFIDMFRDCWADLGEDVARHATDETEVPVCVNASMRCSFMVPDAKRPKERKTIQIWYTLSALWDPVLRDFHPISSGATLRFAISIDCLPLTQAVWNFCFPLSSSFIYVNIYISNLSVTNVCLIHWNWTLPYHNKIELLELEL